MYNTSVDVDVDVDNQGIIVISHKIHFPYIVKSSQD